MKLDSPALAWHAAGSGAGLPILFVHADLGSHRQWGEVMGRFAGERRVVAFDRRGHGDSPVPPSGFGYLLECADIDALRAAAELDRFVIAGHSGGAAVAHLYANTNPERVAGLFLVDPAQSGRAMPEDQARQALDSVLRAPHEAAQAFYRTIAGDAPGVVEQVLSDVRRTDARTIVGLTKALADFDPSAAGQHDRADALVVQQSRNDTPYSIARCAGYRQVNVDGAGHWIQLARPQEVEALLRGFLAGIRSSARA